MTPPTSETASMKSNPIPSPSAPNPNPTKPSAQEVQRKPRDEVAKKGYIIRQGSIHCVIRQSDN